jgi:outer membrane receptor protein involved in Fe transport
MVGKAKFDPTFTEIDLKPEYNEVAPEAYVDLSARYKFEVGGGQLELFGTIENLFEPIPPDVPGGFNGSQTSRGTYDVFGRQYRVGLRTKF